MVFGFNASTVELAQFWSAVIGETLIVVGALLAIFGWGKFTKPYEMAETGLYRYIRHPQYTGFFLFLLGSIINWPTLLTLLTLPILWWVYLRLAKSEEQDAIATFGDKYRDYMSRTGRFLPGIGKTTIADTPNLQN